MTAGHLAHFATQGLVETQVDQRIDTGIQDGDQLNDESGGFWRECVGKDPEAEVVQQQQSADQEKLQQQAQLHVFLAKKDKI